MFLGIIILLAVIGVVLAIVPVDPTIKKVLITVVVLAVIVALLQAFGVFSHGSAVRLP